MLETGRATTIFANARMLYLDALAEFDQVNLRNAAEDAWETNKHGTDALILARTGGETRTTRQTLLGIRQLFRERPGLQHLQLQYGYRSQILHDSCFYDGICGPEDVLTQDARDTVYYAHDAERSADRK